MPAIARTQGGAWDSSQVSPRVAGAQVCELSPAASLSAHGHEAGWGAEQLGLEPSIQNVMPCPIHTVA